MKLTPKILARVIDENPNLLEKHKGLLVEATDHDWTLEELQETWKTGELQKATAVLANDQVFGPLIHDVKQILMTEGSKIEQLEKRVENLEMLLANHYHDFAVDSVPTESGETCLPEYQTRFFPCSPPYKPPIVEEVDELE